MVMLFKSSVQNENMKEPYREHNNEVYHSEYFTHRSVSAVLWIYHKLFGNTMRRWQIELLVGRSNSKSPLYAQFKVR